MFIRRTHTRKRTTGEPYFTHRLVDGLRVGAAVKQRTLLNPGAHLDLPQAQWPSLAARIEQLLHGQFSLLAHALPEVVETLAQRCGAAHRAPTGGACRRVGAGGRRRPAFRKSIWLRSSWFDRARWAWSMLEQLLEASLAMYNATPHGGLLAALR